MSTLYQLQCADKLNPGTYVALRDQPDSHGIVVSALSRGSYGWLTLVRGCDAQVNATAEAVL